MPSLTHHKHGDLEVFLVFDLEFAYGAALHLIMANSVFPGADEHGYSQQTLALLDEMISRGNKVAETRKTELVRIQALCQELAMQSERRGLETLTLTMPEGSETHNDTGSTEEAHQATPVPGPGTVAMMCQDPPHSPSTTMDPNASSEFMDNLGISSYEFFSLVDQLENQDISTIIG